MSKYRKGTIAILLIAIFMMSTLTFVVSAKPKKGYNTITEGEVLYSAGHYLSDQVIPTGFDDYGYNYQGHMFKGSYFNVYAGRDGFPAWTGGDDEAYLAENSGAENHWAWPYREVKLVMKWNDAWLSNMDRDDDGSLDRHYGYETYIGSGAWETNHQWGLNDDGTRWNYFVKIVAVPGDAYYVDANLNNKADDGEMWYTSEEIEIGPSIWSSFAKTMWVENDPAYNVHGAQYVSPESAGFGHYKP